MADFEDDDDGRFHLPFAVYAVIGVLAVIGLFSISGLVFGFFWWLVRALVLGAIALLVLVVLKNVFWGRSDKTARTD